MSLYPILTETEELKQDMAVLGKIPVKAVKEEGNGNRLSTWWIHTDTGGKYSVEQKYFYKLLDQYNLKKEVI